MPLPAPLPLCSAQVWRAAVPIQSALLWLSLTGRWSQSVCGSDQNEQQRTRDISQAFVSHLHQERGKANRAPEAASFTPPLRIHVTVLGGRTGQNNPSISRIHLGLVQPTIQTGREQAITAFELPCLSFALLPFHRLTLLGLALPYLT